MCDGNWDPKHYKCHKNIKDCERIWLPYWQAFISGGLVEMFESDTIEDFKQLEYVKFAAETVGISIDDYTEIVECMYDDEDWGGDLGPYADALIHNHPKHGFTKIYTYPLESHNSEQWFSYINWFKENGQLSWEWK